MQLNSHINYLNGQVVRFAATTREYNLATGLRAKCGGNRLTSFFEKFFGLQSEAVDVNCISCIHHN